MDNFRVHTYPDEVALQWKAERDAARAEVERQKTWASNQIKSLMNTGENLVIDANKLQEERDKFRAALEWIAGKTDKPYCTYYERILPDGTEVPTYCDIAEKALKETT